MLCYQKCQISFAKYYLLVNLFQHGQAHKKLSTSYISNNGLLEIILIKYSYLNKILSLQTSATLQQIQSPIYPAELLVELTMYVTIQLDYNTVFTLHKFLLPTRKNVLHNFLRDIFLI